MFFSIFQMAGKASFFRSSAWEPARMSSASWISSSLLSRGTRPISFKYTFTGSSMATPSAERELSNSSTLSSVRVKASLSGSSTISTPWLSMVS